MEKAQICVKCAGFQSLCTRPKPAANKSREQTKQHFLSSSHEYSIPHSAETVSQLPAGSNLQPSFMTNPFKIVWLQNQQYVIFELHKVIRSTDYGAIQF